MQSNVYVLEKYEADEGMVFDWKEPRYIEVPVDPEHPETGMKQEQEHLYTKTLFIGSNDNIDNYIETPEVKE